MSDPMPDQYAPGAPYPDPTAASGPTAWAPPAQDYAGRPDGAAPWAEADLPAAVPPAIEPPTLRMHVDQPQKSCARPSRSTVADWSISNTDEVRTLLPSHTHPSPSTSMPSVGDPGRDGLQLRDHLADLHRLLAVARTASWPSAATTASCPGGSTGSMAQVRGGWRSSQPSTSAYRRELAAVLRAPDDIRELVHQVVQLDDARGAVLQEARPDARFVGLPGIVGRFA